MKIACYDSQTQALTYQAPLGGALVYDVEDVEMHRFIGESLDLCVTPKHRMLWSTQYGLEKVAPIEEMLATCTRPNFVARIDRYDEGEVLGDFSVPWVPLRSGSNYAYDAKPNAIPASDFLELIGWYVSEGCASPQLTEFSLCQKASRHWPRMLAVVQRLERRGFAYRIADPEADIRYAHVVDKSLTTWLSLNAGFRSHQKRVPALIKGLCHGQLTTFFNALMAGDGTVDSREDRRSGAYSTTSKQLADDVQEIAIKLGYRTKLREEPAGTLGIRPVYRVLLSKGARAKGDGRTQAVRYETHHSREVYTGKVYCFSVPTGVFVTRRNGVVAIQGNTAFASYTVAEAQVFKPERDMFDEIISLKLLTAMGYDGYRLRSRPLVIEDATLKLQGIEVVMGMGDQVEPGDVVTEVNNITGTKLKVSDAAPDLATKLRQQQVVAMGGQPGVGGPTGQAAPGPMAGGTNQPIKPINPQPKSPTGLPTPGSPTRLGGQPGQIKPKQVPTAMGGNQTTPLGMAARKSDDVQDLALKAVSALKALRKRDFSELAAILPTINALDHVSRETFETYVADLSFIDTSFDPVGLAALASATMDVLSTCDHQHGGGSE